jgi:hypothetical protein
MPSSSIKILEVLSITLLAAMDPESPTSRHPTDADEEDSPLPQSSFTSSQPMADSYPEDFSSEAEEDAKDQAADEMVDEEELDGGGEAGEAEQGGGIEAKEAEKIPANLHGYWVKCHVKDAHVQLIRLQRIYNF